MVQINSGMVTHLSFKISIEGGSPVSRVQISIHLDDKMKLTYIGNYLDNTATFAIEGFEKYGKSGTTYPFDLEIFMENQYFVPLQDHFTLKAPTLVKADLVKSNEEPVKPSPKVNAEMLEKNELDDMEELIIKKAKKSDIDFKTIVTIDEAWASRRK
jgi:hypothetical protein